MDCVAAHLKAWFSCGLCLYVSFCLKGKRQALLWSYLGTHVDRGRFDTNWSRIFLFYFPSEWLISSPSQSIPVKSKLAVSDSWSMCSLWTLVIVLFVDLLMHLTRSQLCCSYFPLNTVHWRKLTCRGYLMRKERPGRIRRLTLPFHVLTQPCSR